MKPARRLPNPRPDSNCAPRLNGSPHSHGSRSRGSPRSNGSPRPRSSSRPRSKPLLSDLHTEVLAGGYFGCDLVELVGGFTGYTRLLKINAAPEIPLSNRQWLVVLVLMAQKCTASGLPTTREIVAEPYLSAQEILNVLDEWKLDEPKATWNGDATTVYRVIYKLREKLERAGFPNLIRSRPKEVGGGYRLETPGLMVTISMTSPPKPRLRLQRATFASL